MDQMDVDDAHTARKHTQPSRVLPIDRDHPFDFDQYITNYTGRSLVDRLIFLIPQCPSLAVQATKVATRQLKSMRDVSLVTQLQAAYEQAAANAPPEAPLPSFSDVAKIDGLWVDDMNRRNQEERVKLEVELKTYSSNMIKESIRVSGVL